MNFFVRVRLLESLEHLKAVFDRRHSCCKTSVVDYNGHIWLSWSQAAKESTVSFLQGQVEAGKVRFQTDLEVVILKVDNHFELIRFLTVILERLEEGCTSV